MLYLLNTTFYTISLKSLEYFYGINDVIFCCFLFGLYFPVLFIFHSYEKMNIQKLDVICGILDYIQLILFYISLNKLSITEYLSYRTFSILFNIILGHQFLDIQICKYRIIGILIIILSCSVLLFSSSTINIFYSLLVIFSSFVFSLIGFLVEKFPNYSNYIQIKSISSLLNIFTYILYNIYDNSSSIVVKLNSNYLVFWVLVLFMGFSEIVYYFLKLKIIARFTGGSIYTNILDVLRRIITMISGVFIFNDSYNKIYISCFSFICLGCVFIQFNEQLKHIFEKIENNQRNRLETIEETAEEAIEETVEETLEESRENIKS